MSLLRKKQTPSGEQRFRDRWLVSYADLMTLLLALFIVLYAAADKDRAEQIAAGFAGQNTGGAGILPGQKPSKESDQAFTAALVRDPALRDRAGIRQTKRGLVVSLSEAGFFPPGEAVVSPEARQAIGSLAASLKDTGYRIRVEGHTDSRPIANARYPSNWELSTARAAAVLMLLAERGIAPERLSAAGYGGFQPVADNATAPGRARNRRVDVVILNRDR